MTDLVDKEAIREIGQALWELRRSKRMPIQDVSLKTHIPLIRIDLLETGRGFSFKDYKKLTRFYGKKMKVSFEE